MYDLETIKKKNEELEQSLRESRQAPVKNQVERLMEYEDGALNEEQEAQLFQELIDTGLVWALQGSYGRHAKYLIAKGLCHERAAAEKTNS